MRPVPRHRSIHPLPAVASCLGAALVLLASAGPCWASFHLNEITRVMAGYNGDATVQAVELKSLSAGENLVGGDSINVYGPTGLFVASLGHFTGSVANSAAGAHLLCATTAFQTTFGIAADLTISPGIPAGTGQVAFQTGICLVNAVAYGDIVTPKDGATSAAALPSGLAYVLVRTVDDATIPSCPLAEDAAARFALRSANTTTPITFTNNAGATVNVSSAVTAVEPTPLPREARIVVTPNPSSGRVSFSASLPGPGRLRVYSSQGRLVWETAVTESGRRVVGWDGMDGRGGRAPSGVYLLELETAGVRRHARFLLLR